MADKIEKDNLSNCDPETGCCGPASTPDKITNNKTEISGKMMNAAILVPAVVPRAIPVTQNNRNPSPFSAGIS